MSDQSAEDFASRAKAWLEANAPRRGPDGMEDDARGPASIPEQKAFQAKLYEAGFAGITWPVEYGGQGLTNAEQIAFSTEARNYSLPTGAFLIGLGMPGPTILEMGSEEQKQRYLRPMLRGDEIWCQLFSEPGAGSDVASLQTSAVRDGDEWVLNGQKVWTSGAQYSDYGAIIARTDPTVPKHNGITMFIVDMHAPGVTVRPLKVATGASPFNEVFFDNVRLPADAVINKVNNGWAAAVVMLRNERVTIGTAAPARTSPLAFDSLSKLAATLGRTDQGTARALAGLYARERASGLFGQVLREEAMSGRDPAARGSEAKLAGAVLGLHAANVALELLGSAAAGSTNEDVQAVITAIIGVPSGSIAGGSNEIQRNIIGERVLGLPKDPGVDRSIPFNQLAVGTQKR
ncbi:MAG TPA: acyl-CoA dehydrogenase family protein [Streptosporangiaceae bacterium]|jgi:alkylation response protein AidB-like acyl-CoA dehydrogenase